MNLITERTKTRPPSAKVVPSLMARSVDCGRIRTMTTAAESHKMAAIPQIIDLQIGLRMSTSTIFEFHTSDISRVLTLSILGLGREVSSWGEMCI